VSVHFGVKLPIFRTTVVLLQHFNNFERKASLPSGLLGLLLSAFDAGGLP
jgi:hypothetical protein